MRDDGVVQGERVIPRHSEDVLDTDVVEPAKNVITYGDAHLIVLSLMDRPTPAF